MADTPSTFDTSTVAFLAVLVVLAVVLPALAWRLGVFDRSRTGRHAADRPRSAPWVNEMYRDARDWIARNDKVQSELADARRGGNR